MSTPPVRPTWDAVWDQIFQARSWGKYPKEEVIRFVARNYYNAKNRSEVRFLDLGCGYGASTWYLAREGFRVDAVDGSAVVIKSLRQRLVDDGLLATLAVADIGNLPYPPNTFDCVIDVACLMHNTPEDTRRILDGVYERLKPGGKLLSVTATDACFGSGMGELVDTHTWRDITNGPFSNMGVARFSDETQVRELYGRFERLSVNRSEYTQGSPQYWISNWVIECSRS